MNKRKILKKIREVEREIQNCKLCMVTSQYFKDLLEIHEGLYDFLYFKLNQEKKFLKPIKGVKPNQKVK